MTGQPRRLPVYGIGYSGRSLDDLKQVVEQLNAYLVDIRYAPYSRNPAFRKARLQEALGSRYIHLGALGNRNYKGGPVEIADYDAGRVALEALDRPAVLMCVCKDPATCHRTIVLQRLAEDGFEVHELGAHDSRQLQLL